LYGDGIDETMRANAGLIFLFKKHLARLQHYAAFLSLKLPLSLSETGEVLNESLRINQLKEANVSLHVSRG
jgi:branched-subunit amino acid aminotransferase/4-amino-4-deoxychorismate lyase